MEALRAALTMLLGIALPLAVQLWDREQLPPDQARRTWGYATWGAALYAFGPLSMLGWIFVTRPPWWRCLVAIPYTMAPLVALVAHDLGLALVLGEAIDSSPGEVLASMAVAAVAIAIVMVVIELVTRVWRALSARPKPGDDRDLEVE